MTKKGGNAQKQSALLMQIDDKLRKQLSHLVPKRFIQRFINGNCLDINIREIKPQDVNFLLLIMSLPFKQIHIFIQNQQLSQSPIIKRLDSKLLDENHTEYLQKMMQVLSQQIQRDNKHLRSIKLQNIAFQSTYLESLSIGIQKAKYLKQFSVINCSLNDSLIDLLKNSLSQNVSLTSIDFSFNHLQDIGQTMVFILNKHGQRKKNILTLHQQNNITPKFNISNTGIYQLNLEGNHLSAQTIQQITAFLINDRWVKSINLKQNQLQQQQIIKFLPLLQSNSTLINLDLRLNPGFNKRVSKIIFSKLKQNLTNLKSSINANKPENSNNHQGQKVSQQNKEKQNAKQFYKFNKQLTKSDLFSNRLQKNLITKVLIKSPQRLPNASNHHSGRKPISSAQKNNENQLGSFSKIQKQNQTLEIKILKSAFLTSKNQRNQIHENKKSLKISSDEAIHIQCQKCCVLQAKLRQVEKKCNQMHIRTLKSEKQNLQLEIQLKKLKSFIEKNRDVSVIGTSANKISLQNPPQLINQNSNVSTSFNRILGSQNDDQMISRIQVLVTELTRIMETVEQFQNTQNTIDHPFSNVNSFSKTVSLYERPQELKEIHQQILQDQALHLEQFGSQQITIIQSGQKTEERKMEKKEII